MRIKIARTNKKIPSVKGTNASRYPADGCEEEIVACCCSVNEFKIAGVLELARK